MAPEQLSDIQGELALSPLHTAILLLGDSAGDEPGGPFEAGLRPVPGVRDVTIETADGLVAINYDEQHVSLADLVRTVEDLGVTVSSVARRDRA